MGIKKKDIVHKLATELDVALGEAENIYNVVIDEIIGKLGEGTNVKLSGFGSFQVVTRQPKLGRNPRTGDRLQIPKHTSVKFKMGKNLINAMNGE